ncbi:MAG: MBL fold metallo-hydrolase [Proteobacteria bacterium]|nr:MBL fold metallo-hydrolase [Pseudomonadota bacterium]
MTFITILAVFLAIIFAGLSFSLIKLNSGNRAVRQVKDSVHIDKLTNIGTVKKLSVLPLVEYYADDDRLKTEAGVSYLIRTEDTTILMDVGFNKNKTHPSPLLHNAKILDVALDKIDAIFISHAHLDHLGGMHEQKNKLFSISQGDVHLPGIPVYSPAPVSPSHFNLGPFPKVIKAPQILEKGIASIGVIPRNLFLMGYTEENSLAVNVENKGIVLIIGCGHQTIEKIIERAKRLFDAPIYGIIGGLHFPVKSGRIMIGPFNIQNIVGSDRPPWNGINENDVKNAIIAIKNENPAFIALSPHDSSDWSIAQFRDAFRDKYHELKVGKELHL